MGTQTHKNHGLNKDMVEQLYLRDGLSDSEIGSRFGLTGEGVAYFRRKYGIKTISQSDRISIRARKIGLMELSVVSDDELIRLYDKHGMVTLGRMFGCSKIPIREKLRRLGVCIKTKQDRTVSGHPDSLSLMQQEVLIGSLLGDGCLVVNNLGDAAHFQEMHSAAQRRYLEWKHDVFMPFSKRIHKEDKVLDDGRESKGFGFKTCVHPLFVRFYDMFYGGAKKHLPDGLMRNISPLSLAVWYMDDGCLSDQNKDGVFTIASGFCKESVEVIADSLNDRFQFDIEVREVDSVSVLVFHNKQKFFDVIGRHIVPSMAYKVPLSLRFSMPHIRNPKLYGLPNKLSPAEVANPSEGLLDDLVEFWQVAGFPFPSVPKKDKRLSEIEAVRNSKIELSEVVGSGFSSGCGLCLSFFENVWSVKRHGQKSPEDVFYDKALLRHAIRDCLKHRGGCRESELRSELRTFGGVQTFRPVVARAIYDRYCPVGGRVLDPCSGWGGRLLGFYASVVSEYIGVDANPDTVKGLKHMRCLLGRDVAGKSVDIKYAAFEDLKLDGSFDVVFTSPPYFCKELYGDDEFQSYVRYGKYNDWRDGFLKPLVEKSVSVLKRGGFLILNVADVRVGGDVFPLVEDTRSLMKSVIGLFAEHNMEFLSPYGGKTRFEPILVGRKD